MIRAKPKGKRVLINKVNLVIARESKRFLRRKLPEKILQRDGNKIFSFVVRRVKKIIQLASNQNSYIICEAEAKIVEISLNECFVF